MNKQVRSSTEVIAEMKRLKAADKAYNSLVNEGCEGYERDGITLELHNELAEALAREWTAKWTASYWEAAKAKWNDAAKRLQPKYKAYGLLAQAIEKETGLSLNDMQKAKQIYG